MEIPEHPTVADFYKYQRRILNWFALWPAPSVSSISWRLLHSVYFWALYMVFIFWFSMSMLIKLLLNYNDLDEIIKVFYILVTICSYEAKFINVKLHNDKYLKLFESLHIEDFEPRNPREVKIFEKTGINSCRVRNIYGIITLTTLSTLVLTNLIISNHDTPFSTYHPIDIEKPKNFAIMYTYQFLALTTTAFVDIAFDSLCPSLYIFITGQLEILSDRMRHLGMEPSSAKIEYQLKYCVRHYIRIVDLARSVERIVTWPVSLQIFCSVLVLVANLYAMTIISTDIGNFIRFFIYEICMLSQIFLFCFFANGIIEKSEALSHDIYSSNWFEWSKKDCKLMILMMLRFSQPIKIRTINRNYAFSLAAFSSIVNSSYSYFALLKRVNS